MRDRAAWIAVVVVALLEFTAPRGEARPSENEEARRLAKEGTRLLDAERYGEALEQLQHAYALWSSPKILINIGTALKLLGRNVEAANAYDKALADPELDQQVKASVAGVLAEVNARLGRLTIHVDQVGARVIVDGRVVGESPAPASARVDPGSHTVTAERLGFVTAAATVAVAAGEDRVVDLVLERIAVTPPETAKPEKLAAIVTPLPGASDVIVVHRDPWYEDTLGWIAAGAGGIGIGVGLALRAKASSLDDDATAEQDLIRRRSILEDADSTRKSASIVLTAGALVAAVGIVKLAWPADEKRSRREGTRVAWGTNWVGLEGEF